MAKQEDMADPSASQTQATTNINGTSVTEAAGVAGGGTTTGRNSNSGLGSSGSSGSGSSSHPPLQSTVFIHKLYNILEDDDLKDLIWWSPSGLSFLIRPTEKFSRALATYFKHTNIASFVRQLNMYGFHKVSNDHCKSTEHDSGSSNANSSSSNNNNGNSTNGSNNNNNNNNNSTVSGGGSSTDVQEDIKIWKFRHSTGLFKRGDIEGLKYIKRRSSRNISNSNGRKNSNPAGQANHLSSGANANGGSANDANFAGASVTDVCGTSQMHPSLAYASFPTHPTPAAAAPPPPSNCSDPYLEARYAEISQSYNVLRYEYNSLQYRHDEVLDQLRGVNADMVHLLELLESLVAIQSSPEPIPQRLSGLEQELVRFKTLLTGRMHRNSDAQIHQPSQKSYFENRPLSSLSVPSHSNVPSLVQHVFAVPARPSSAVNVVQQAPTAGPAPSSSVSAPPPPPPHAPDHFAGSRMMMMNPFETTGNSSKRNMSILMDPLAPAPNLMVAMSPSNPQPFRNPSPVTASTATYRNSRQADRGSKMSVLASKNLQSSSYSDSSSGSSSLSQPQMTTSGTPAGQGVGASAGVAPIKEEQQVMTMAEPLRPPSAKDHGDIVRPIPTRSVGPPDNTRGSSGVYSLLNDDRSASPLDDEMTPTKKVKY
ncbi:hypothetical protein ZYGM_002127 [Zygosaccharomyces mellis]|uniref:HSF-type DNA-binding domain-containing protein n=1 Tax=Zygosaccharomyces mellis TaxID=42258 RepID=A0A4C2E502_9SACH|nr:hypothetical protein ZYGM_002127 [Zygosaccharomyces mellis]